MLVYKFLGSGGVRPFPNRGLTSLFVQNNSTSILLDCGECVQSFAAKYNISLFNIDAIMITHLHADHILGIPGLLASMANNNRKKPLIVFGPPGVKDKIYSMIGLLYGLTFKVFTVELKAGDNVDLGNLQIQAVALQHSITCYGYVITVSRPPTYKPEIVAETGLSDAAVALMQAGYTIEYNGMQLDINTVFGYNRETLKIVYATDTGVCQNLIQACENADVAILDGSYGEDSQRPHINTSEIHMSFAEAAKVAKEANVKKLILTHFSPIVSTPWVFLHNATEIFENTECAYGNMSGDLTFCQIAVPELDVIEAYAGTIYGIIRRGSGFLRVPKPFKPKSSQCCVRSPECEVIAQISEISYMRNGERCEYAEDPDIHTSVYVDLLQCTKWFDRKEQA